MNKTLQHSLTELFMHLADAVDSGESLPKHLREAYLREFKEKQVQDFYSKLVANNPFNALL